MVINSKKSKLMVVAGPTASGKTDFAVKLAKEVGGEIVNADSRQVYRLMDIGTNKGVVRGLCEEDLTEELKDNAVGAKGLANETRKGIRADTETRYLDRIRPFEIENSGIVGWLFDIVYPDEEFNLADYQFLAREVIKNINYRGKVAILTGGTGLYIDAVIKDYDMGSVTPDLELRKKLGKLSVEELQAKLEKLDKAFFENLSSSEKNNLRRLVRMIEKLEAGASVSGSNSDTYIDHEFLYLDISREKLYDSINKRAEEMFKQGFVEEVEDLIKKGHKNTKPMQGIGYREVAAYLDGETTLEECVEKTKQAHRNYAKRQITWFRNVGFKKLSNS